MTRWRNQSSIAFLIWPGMSQKAGWLSPPPETLPPEPEPLLGTGGPTCTPGRPLPGAMSIVNSRCDFAGRHQSAEGGSWSESSSQNDQLPALVGTPLTRPSEASDSPGGSAPPRIVNW